MKRILVALDASTRAQVILATAISVARAMGAKVRLFRAVPLQTEMPMVRQFLRLEERHAKADLDAYEVPAELRDGVEAKMGTPWSAIAKLAQPTFEDYLRLCDPQTINLVASFQRTIVNDLVGKTLAAAREYDADLIVVGSRGRTAMDRLRSTTAKVVGHADTSVLVVRCAD